MKSTFLSLVCLGLFVSAHAATSKPVATGYGSLPPSFETNLGQTDARVKFLSRGRGYGCITDIILGLVGSFIGGWVFTKLGIFGGGFIFSLAAATLGAVILVALVHLFTGGPKN